MLSWFNVKFMTIADSATTASWEISRPCLFTSSMSLSAVRRSTLRLLSAMPIIVWSAVPANFLWMLYLSTNRPTISDTKEPSWSKTICFIGPKYLSQVSTITCMYTAGVRSFRYAATRNLVASSTDKR